MQAQIGLIQADKEYSKYLIDLQDLNGLEIEAEQKWRSALYFRRRLRGIKTVQNSIYS